LTAPRCVTLDIETAPLTVHCWGLFDQNIGLEQVIEDWSILAFSAKWLGEERVIYRDSGGRGRSKVRDDKALVRELHSILDKADIVITQNGVAFDIKKINSRLLHHGHKPYSPIKVVDTLLAAKRHMSFASNKLAWMSQLLTDTPKDEHKKFPGFSLWAECLKDNPAAWREMRKYNVRDVVATEKVYLELRPWIVGHPNIAVFSQREEVECPKCGSLDVQMRGRAFTQSGEYHRFQCKKCGGWARSRYTLNSTEKRHASLSQ
jgi:RNase P subunit RPR2